MNRGDMVLVGCTIEAGAFSGERVFRLGLADGEEYSGVAPVHHLRDGEKRPLGRNVPPAGRSIAGYVEGFLVEDGGDRATVEFPNGEAHRVHTSQVPFRRSRDREAPYVPTGS
jgi:hypothetical protein